MNRLENDTSWREPCAIVPEIRRTNRIEKIKVSGINLDSLKACRDNINHSWKENYEGIYQICPQEEYESIFKSKEVAILQKSLMNKRHLYQRLSNNQPTDHYLQYEQTNAPDFSGKANTVLSDKYRP